MQIALVLALGLGCGLQELALLQDEGSDNDEGGLPTDPFGIPPFGETPGDTDPPEDPPPLETDFPADLQLAKVSANQAVDRPVWEDFAEVANDLPLISEREMLLRIFVDPQPGFGVREIVAVLTLSSEGVEPVEYRDTILVDRPSTDGDPDSTFNFLVPPEEVLLTTEMVIELREVDDAAPGGGDPALTVFDSGEDMVDGLPIIQGHDMKVVVFPFRFNADGSGRLPDTSDAAMAELQGLIEATYPLRSVEVVVGEVVEWGGSGIDNALDVVTDLRDAADEEPNTYYYALYNPADSFGQYCRNGCVTGLCWLVTNPNSESLRACAGVGFRDGAQNGDAVSDETLIHEIGHAHGRNHAPCGTSGDNNYPYGGGSIGVWGYDRRNFTLLDPSNYTDMMGYCNTTWISDYNFNAILDRVDTLATSPRAAKRTVTRLKVSSQGDVVGMTTIGVHGPSAGEPVEIDIFDATGAQQGTRTGWMVRYSHLPGGTVLLDELLEAGWTARLR